MNPGEILKAVGDRLQASSSVKSVYGEPISKADRTVIPVARISYGFGAGGGNPSGERPSEAGGGGGGGYISATPVGIIEITPERTRFIALNNWKRCALAALAGFILGCSVGARRSRS